MYDINKRKIIENPTVGQLQELIKDLPPNMQLAICGDDRLTFHVEDDGSFVCLDNCDLDDDYEKEYTVRVKEVLQRDIKVKALTAIDARRQVNHAYSAQKIVLNADDFEGASIHTIENE